MNADHFRDTMQMVADPDDLWVEWYTENADKLTISCYADETLSHCSFVAGYRAHEALQLAVLSLEGISGSAKEIPSNSCKSGKNLQELTWQDMQRIVDCWQHTAKLTKTGGMRPQEEIYTEVLKRFNEQR